MATPPVIDARWAYDPLALKQDPGTGKREIGFAVEIPTVQTMNWQLYNIGEWIAYLTEEIGLIEGVTGVFDAIVGAGGYNDINEVMLAMGDTLPVSNVRIFVKNSLSIENTQVINRDGVEIIFHPQASIVKATTQAVGMRIDALRCKITAGRFLNFDEVGGIALELTSNAKNCIITNNMFFNNADSIANSGSNNVIANNIEEIV